MRTSVTPDGFVYGIHKPSYAVRNLRSRTRIENLGLNQDGTIIDNTVNYPNDDIEVPRADWIYEIANPFSFRGTTFIGKTWADKSASDYGRIKLPARQTVSMSKVLDENGIDTNLFKSLPGPVQLCLATTSTDPNDLICLARLSCTFWEDDSKNVTGLRYLSTAKKTRADINDHALFEAVANNPALPSDYKIAMVIRPGAQGASEIVGDYHDKDQTHIYEYLRRNSYIGGGHYAANMADNAIRYNIDELKDTDICGLRHLYYQRTYVRLADKIGIQLKENFHTPEDLEIVRKELLDHLSHSEIEASSTLWGWNFGFDYASSGYRLHASHQQIHQQYAIIPKEIESFTNGRSELTERYRPFSSGDMIGEVIDSYHKKYQRDFFRDYLQAIISNKRMDERHDLEKSLIVWEDDNILLYVPKAQTSQWELQLMTKPKNDSYWPGNILETNLSTRRSIDTAILKAQQALAGRGARMVTSIEYSKRFNSDRTSQPLIYCLMPKLPESPGAFSETQLRFINGHYPEDFAAACRKSLTACK